MKYDKTYLNSSELASWDQFVSHHPHGSFLQTSHWAKVKSPHWSSQALVLSEGGNIVAGALIFELKLPFGQMLRYIPYGPLWTDDGNRDAILKELSAEKAGLALRLEPYYEAREKLDRTFSRLGFHRTGHSYQPEETIILDLTKPEEELLAEMRQTTRRYIRQAERAGLSVLEDPTGEKLPEFYRIMKDVSSRVGFGIHDSGYYESIFHEFGSAAKLFSVYDGKKIVGSYFLLTQDHRAWELYGGVLAEAQEKRANYLLKWAVIRAMKAQGITYYDQWGVAPEGASHHALSGVTYFKEGFGGSRLTLIGAHERVTQPLVYRALLSLSGLAALIRGLLARLHG